MKLKILFAMAFFAMPLLHNPIAAQTTATPGSFPADSTAISRLAEKFKECIIRKDTTTLKTLFFNDNVKWISVADSKTIEVLKKYNPDAEPVMFAGVSDLFRDSRMASVAFKEEFYHPVLQTDGIMASYSFDYCFKFNGIIQNWGKENWQLIKVNNEWKIIALVFSFNPVFVYTAPAYMK